MSENREKVIAKIEKLLALSANNPSEDEALAAAEKVQALLAEYGLHLSEIRSKHDPIIKDNDLLTDRVGWVKPLLNSVAKLYFCGYYFETFPADWIKDRGFDKNSRSLIGGSHGRAFFRHSFIGEQANIIVAKNMAEYLIKAMERLCKTGEKSVVAQERASYRFSFMNTCTARLCARLYERRMKSSESGIQSNGTNLPALRSLYQQAEDAVAAFLQDQGTNLKNKKSMTKISHEKGAQAGFIAGSNIGLDNQVGGRNNRLLN